MVGNISGRQNYWHWGLLILVFCCAFFVNNDAIFVDLMESRNLITAREMVSDGNWLIPTMNGDLRLEKPPLPTWIAAGIELLSPDNISLQRSMSAVAGVLLVVFFYLLAVRMTRSRMYALVSSLVLCTSYSIILMARTVTWDIYCHAFMMGAIYFLYCALQEKECQWKYFIGAGILMGLSFLGKGPVSFYALLLPFICAYAFVYRHGTKGKGKGILLMGLIAFLLGVWWYAYIYMYHPEISSFVIKKESTSWLNHNVRPWYYYWKFFLETGVWSVLTLTALAFPYWKKRVQWEWKDSYMLTFVWMVLMVVLLSLFPEKKSRYLFPVLIPASLTLGHVFMYWIQGARRRMLSRGDKVVYRLNAYLVAIVSLSLPGVLYWFVVREGWMSVAQYVVLSGLLLVVSAGLFCAAARVRPFSFLLGVVALFAVAELFLMPYIGKFIKNEDFKSIRATRTIEELQPLPFYYDKNGTFRIELVYEANKKIRPLDLSNREEVMEKLPFVLVSQRPAEEAIPDSIRKDLSLRFIDRYDNNRWMKGSRRYSDIFVNNVTVVTTPTPQP